MDNILILGVEGSGKTVLAMAFAKVFAGHAGDGYRLKPENQAAFRFLEQMPASLYAVPRPPEQPGRYADLRFTACRGQEELFALDVPECPPELFRVAFQEAAGQPDPAAFAARAEALKGDLEALRARIAGASRVLVLFDVSSIRGGDGEAQPAHLDAVWATNACIRHLLGRPYPPAVSLVLTHADRDPASGNDFAAILRRRLPLLADNYPQLPGFAVSSVKPDDPEVGLQPLLFSLFGKTAPLDGLLDEARRAWAPLVAAAAAPDADALRAAADRLDALRGQAPWYAQGSHALFFAPEVADTLRRFADTPPADGTVADALKAAFPLLAAAASAPAPKREIPPRSHSHGGSRTHSHSAPPAGNRPAAAAAVPGGGSAPASSHHHHHHRHGGRHTPNRRFFRRLKRHLPWVLAAIVLALALHYGLPAARDAYGRHCLDRGLRISATRPADAHKALLAARKYRAAGADLALVLGQLSGAGGKTDPEAAAAEFDACRWTYSRPADLAQFHGVIRHVRRLADSGDPNARYLVARMLDEGKGGNRDPEEALRLMVDAASRQQPQAMSWLAAKAGTGDTEAQAALGRLYLAGQGPEGHEAESVRWVLVAGNHGAEGAPEWLDAQAESGNAAAQFVIGRKAELRARKTGNNAPAIEWYRKAAAQGNADALKALARLGVGIEG